MAFLTSKFNGLIPMGTDLALYLSEGVGKKVLLLAGQWLYFTVAFLTHIVNFWRLEDAISLRVWRSVL